MMHITDDKIFDAVFTIKNNLKVNGRLLLSVPVERPDLDDESRSPDGRLFIMRQPEYYTLILERLGFSKIASYEDKDGLGRKGVKWATMVFALDSAESSFILRSSINTKNMNL